MTDSGTAKSPDLGIVVNYFTNFGAEDTHRLVLEMTALNLRFLKRAEAVGTVLLVDGSPRSDTEMRDRCEELGVRYHHDGEKISYVRSYNLGWQALSEPYIGLMANDIIPHPADTLDRLPEWIKRPDVGCAFPYLSSNRLESDETQRPGLLRGRRSCEPATMTLNLNLFKREVLEEIGGLDENYLFGYGEPILLIRVRSLGYRAVMVGNTRAFHYDRLTKAVGESSLTTQLFKDDTERWFREFAPYASHRGVGHLRLSQPPFSTTPSARTLWRLAEALPTPRLRETTIRLTMFLEPLVTRYPARGGRQGP